MTFHLLIKQTIFIYFLYFKLKILTFHPLSQQKRKKENVYTKFSEKEKTIKQDKNTIK